MTASKKECIQHNDSPCFCFFPHGLLFSTFLVNSCWFEHSSLICLNFLQTCWLSFSSSIRHCFHFTNPTNMENIVTCCILIKVIQSIVKEVIFLLTFVYGSCLYLIFQTNCNNARHVWSGTAWFGIWHRWISRTTENVNLKISKLDIRPEWGCSRVTNIFEKIIFGALQHNQFTITGYKMSNHGTMAHTTVHILLS